MLLVVIYVLLLVAPALTCLVGGLVSSNLRASYAWGGGAVLVATLIAWSLSSGSTDSGPIVDAMGALMVAMVSGVLVLVCAATMGAIVREKRS